MDLEQPESRRRRKDDADCPPPVIAEATLKMGKEIRRWLNVLTFLTVVLYLILGGVAGWNFTQNRKNTEALCAVRNEEQQDADANARFLTENPRGTRGIHVEDVQEAINNSREVVRSLQNLDCPPPPPVPRR